MMARVVDLAISGIRGLSLRRHSFLLGMMGLLTLDGVITALIAGRNPIEWEFDRIIVATVTVVLLAATYGTQDRAAQRKMLLAFGLGTIVLALTSFGGPRLVGRPLGWSVHPNGLGHSCMMGVFACVWLWDNTSDRVLRWAWAGAALLNVVAVMNSGSRGGFLGIALAGLIYLVRCGDRRLTLLGIVAALLAVAVLFSGAVKLGENNPITRLTSQNESNSSGALSDQARQEQLHSDLQRITDHPLVGNGFKDIVLVHVAYLQPWVGAGAVAGLVAMFIGAAMFLLPFVTRRRDLALACGCVAVATAWLMTNIFTLRDQWIFVAIAFASAESISVLGKDRRDRRGALS
jgi:O-antigen ligase